MHARTFAGKSRDNVLLTRELRTLKLCASERFIVFPVIWLFYDAYFLPTLPLLIYQWVFFFLIFSWLPLSSFCVQDSLKYFLHCSFLVTNSFQFLLIMKGFQLSINYERQLCQLISLSSHLLHPPLNYLNPNK